MEKAVQKAKADLAKFEADQGERLGRFGAEREAALAQLAQVEENLPEDILMVYNREVNSRGEDALAAVQNRTCSACYTEITSQMFNDLSRGSFVACKACGRILYLPE
jgi:predicted  nucleic acid-binding Zn-ribbon protein